MFNAIRMDVYRLFKTKSTYIILVIMLAMSVMGTGLMSVMTEMTGAERQQVQTEQMSDNADYAGEDDQFNEDTEGAQSQLSVSVSEIDPDENDNSVLSFAMSDISGLQAGLFIIIFTVLFSMADINSGFIKSIGGQVKGRGVLIVSKMAAIAIFTAIVIIADFLTELIAVNIFFDDAVVGSASEIVRLLSSQFVLNFALAILMMAIAIIIKNNVVSMIIGVCMCTGIFELIFMGINYLMDKIGFSDFDINNILITGKIQNVTIGADAADIGYALLTAAIYIVVSVLAVYNVFKHRDI
ncbi:MAG: ABC transporter permease [Agathobacter sp.]|uniref:ABC transporter permease n=1 Tax=Agathobacter sp. TaxID=2021311 RepID=UPI003991FACB